MLTHSSFSKTHTHNKFKLPWNWWNIWSFLLYCDVFSSVYCTQKADEHELTGLEREVCNFHWIIQLWHLHVYFNKLKYFSETFETSFASLPNQALMKLNSTHLHKNTPSCLDRRIQASVDCHSGGSMRDRGGTLLNQPIHSLSWARRHV